MLMRPPNSSTRKLLRRKLNTGGELMSTIRTTALLLVGDTVGTIRLGFSSGAGLGLERMTVKNLSKPIVVLRRFVVNEFGKILITKFVLVCRLSKMRVPFVGI